MTPRASNRLRWIGIAALLGLLGAGWWARSHLGIEWSLESLHSLVERLGVWAPIGFTALVAARSLLLLPSQLVLTVGGLAFGAVGGTLWGGLGLLLNGVLIFAATRWLGMESVRRGVPKAMRRTLEGAGGPAGAAALAGATSYPVGPIALYQAAAGLTSMSVALYLLAASAGCMIRAALFATFGSSIVEGETGRTLLSLGLILLPLAPLAHPRVRERVGAFLGRRPARRAAADSPASPRGERSECDPDPPIRN